MNEPLVGPEFGSYAPGEVSAAKLSTSCGVGGRPVMSSATRRISVLASASGAGVTLCLSSSCMTKRSTGDLTHASLLTVTSVGFVSFTATNDHCSGHGAP